MSLKFCFSLLKQNLNQNANFSSSRDRDFLLEKRKNRGPGSFGVSQKIQAVFRVQKIQAVFLIKKIQALTTLFPLNFVVLILVIGNDDPNHSYIRFLSYDHEQKLRNIKAQSIGKTLKQHKDLQSQKTFSVTNHLPFFSPDGKDKGKVQMAQFLKVSVFAIYFSHGVAQRDIT